MNTGCNNEATTEETQHMINVVAPAPASGQSNNTNQQQQEQQQTRRTMKKIFNRARNRLQSIHSDVQRMDSIRNRLLTSFPSSQSWPILANERCGCWYVPPTSISLSSSSSSTIPKSVYFKSTDGHVGTWAFSLKRLNWHLLEFFFSSLMKDQRDDQQLAIDENNNTNNNKNICGCIIVDSSHRKLWPDSFSRTIPIWAVVLNRIILRYRHEMGIQTNLNDWDIRLYTPSDDTISKEEHDTISGLLDERVDTLYQSGSIVDPHRLVKGLTKPIRPFWINSTSLSLWSQLEGVDYDKYVWIICLNPSTYSWKDNRKANIEWHLGIYDCNDDENENENDHSHDNDLCDDSPCRLGYYYLPGAADDEESWARHLTPALFWNHIHDLIDPTIDDVEVDHRIDTLVVTGRCHPPQEQQESVNDDPSPSPHHQDTTECGGSLNQIGNLDIWIGTRRSGRPPECWYQFDAILNVTNQEYEGMDTVQSLPRPQHHDHDHDDLTCQKFYLQLPVAEGKRDKTELEKRLPCGLMFLIIHLQQKRRILVHCNQGKDRSVAVVMALLALVCPLKLPLCLKSEFYHWDIQWAVAHNEEEEDSSGKNDNDERCATTRSSSITSGLSQSVIQQLLLRNGREVFLNWIHGQQEQQERQQQQQQQKGRLETEGRQDRIVTPTPQPLADKEQIRVALHLILQYRSQADPTRSTLQKLNRFFMSSPIYNPTSS